MEIGSRFEQDPLAQGRAEADGPDDGAASPGRSAQIEVSGKRQSEESGNLYQSDSAIDAEAANEGDPGMKQSYGARRVKRDGHTYLVYPRPPFQDRQAQIDTVVRELKAGLSGRRQKEFVEKELRPLLEKYGIH